MSARRPGETRANPAQAATRVAFHAPGTVPEDVTAFWAATALANDPINSFLHGREWFLMMTGGRGPDCQVAVLRDAAGKLRAVAPLFPDRRPLSLVVGRKLLFRAEFPVVTLCGGDTIDRDATRGELSVLADAIMHRYPGAQGLWCDHVKAGPRTDRLAQLARSPRHYAVQTLYRVDQYRLILPADLEAFRNLRSRKSRARLESKERAFIRQCDGDYRIVEIRSPGDWEPYAAGIEAMMNGTWQARELGIRFTVDELSGLAARQWLRSFLLVTKGRPAAFALCYQSGDVFHYARIGYDSQFAKHSPGAILLYRLLEHLYTGRTPRYVDLGDGDFEYKRELANDILHVTANLVLRGTPRNRLMFALFRMAQFVNRTGRSLLEVISRGQRRHRSHAT